MPNDQIEHIKYKLVKKALKKGLWENFGQKEYRALQSKYGMTPEIQEFFNWCVNIDLWDLEVFKLGGQNA